MSTESIASSSHTPVGEPCPACGASLAPDQRYCLECGERRTPMSSVMLGGPPAQQAPAGPPPSPPRPPASRDGGWQRNTTLNVIAGVGVLLLAMGVGVLIGRAGVSKSSPGPAEVVTVGEAPAAASGATSTAEATFTSGWPAGTSGYTVQLQTLPVGGTTVGAVEAAKSAATAKGATGVGALRSSEFSSLPSGDYVIYAGVYHARAEAEKELKGLKGSFPAASVIAVSNRGSAATGGGSGAAGSGGGASETHPAPPSVVEGVDKAKGKSYEEKSKELPDVIETG